MAVSAGPRNEATQAQRACSLWTGKSATVAGPAPGAGVGGSAAAAAAAAGSALQEAASKNTQRMVSTSTGHKPTNKRSSQVINPTQRKRAQINGTTRPYEKPGIATCTFSGAPLTRPAASNGAEDAGLSWTGAFWAPGWKPQLCASARAPGACQTKSTST